MTASALDVVTNVEVDRGTPQQRPRWGQPKLVQDILEEMVMGNGGGDRRANIGDQRPVNVCPLVSNVVFQITTVRVVGDKQLRLQKMMLKGSFISVNPRGEERLGEVVILQLDSHVEGQQAGTRGVADPDEHLPSCLAVGD